VSARPGRRSHEDAPAGSGAASGAVTLSDGRSLAYASHGPDAGSPLLYFHGTPASKHNWYLNHDDDLLEALGLRVVAIDRPGMGQSTYQRDRVLDDWPRDVGALADHLGLDRFAVLGYSCGAPYALACAARLGDRVASTSVVSGYADTNHSDLADTRDLPNLRVLRLGLERPRLSRAIYRAMGAMARLAPGRFLGQALATMPPADAEVLSQPSVRQAFLAMFAETLRQGPRGAQHDGAIVSRPWGLPLERIAGPVALWHGTEDRNAPLAMGRHHERLIPGAELHVLPGEGHLSLVHRHIGAILRWALAS
jgi:pimeloyl-ACP methyl ester carboxylesterase